MANTVALMEPRNSTPPRVPLVTVELFRLEAHAARITLMLPVQVEKYAETTRLLLHVTVVGARMAVGDLAQKLAVVDHNQELEVAPTQHLLMVVKVVLVHPPKQESAVQHLVQHHSPACALPHTHSLT